MRILWISHLLPYPPVGGVRIRSYYLLKEICKTNEVHFVGLYQQSHQPTSEQYRAGVAALEEFCTSVSVHPFESFSGKASWILLVLRSFFSRTSYKELWAASEHLSRSIDAHLSRQETDVVHFDTISLLHYFRHLPAGQPVTINHHNIESSMMARRAENQRNPLNKLYFRIEAAKLRRLETRHCRSGMNLVVSSLDQSRLNEIVPGVDSEVIPNGVDVEYFSRIDGQPIEKSLIWVGGLSWYPNLQAVLYTLKEIWPRLIDRVPEARLFIVGRRPPDHLKKEVQRYAHVELLGFVDDIRPLMSRVSGFICPIRDGGGTRLKVLNAMALGVPLIATPLACEGIPVIDGENVLLADSPARFAEQAERLFHDTDLRKKLSSNGRRLIEDEFDFAAIGNKLNGVFQRIRSASA